MANFNAIVNVVKTFVIKNSDKILIGAGITGMGVAGVMTWKAAPKAKEILETKQKEHEEKGEEYKPIEKIKDTAKLWAPPAAVFLGATGCIIGASAINYKRNMVLATAYEATKTSLNEYQRKTIETLGERKAQKIQESIMHDRLEANPKPVKESSNPKEETAVYLTGKGNYLCYDSVSGRYFRSDLEKVKADVVAANGKYLTEMFLSLNEFYDILNLPHIKLGDMLGWNINEDGLINMRYDTTFGVDSEPCIVLDYDISTRYDTY